MRTRDEFVATLKARLDEWNAEIDELEAKARQKKAQADQRYAQRVAELKEKRDEAADKLNEIQGATGAAWETLKDGAEKTWNEFSHTLKETKNAFDAFFEGVPNDENNV